MAINHNLRPGLALLLARQVALLIALRFALVAPTAAYSQREPNAQHPSENHSRLPRCVALGAGPNSSARTVLVLPDGLPAATVAAGLRRGEAVCTATPESLATAIRLKRPKAVVYLNAKRSEKLSALPYPTHLVSYKPLASGQRHTSLAVAAGQRLRFYGRYLSRSRAPLVVLTDRAIPAISAKATVVPWQKLDLASLCASGSQILALIAPIRIQQLAHRLAQPEPSRCRSNWYFTSAARTRTTLKAVMTAVARRKLRAFVLDAIGYYRKQPQLIAALGLPALAELPGPKDSAKIRSLYYVFSALRAAQDAPPRRGTQAPRMGQAYVFRIQPKGLVLDRMIR